MPERKDGSRPARRIEGLDGLRALAVVAVVLFHLRSQSLPGGFVGVDVFFVLSGFLITTLLLREVRTNGHLDLPAFWLRRARRLLPAILLVLLVTVPAAWLVGGDLLVHVRRQVLGALTFSNNWLEISAGSSYFAQTSPELFVNFWSLAVEEQFYLVWPVAFAVLLALVTRARYRIGLILVVAGASALLMGVLVTPGQDATRAYYGTDSHLFGLMIGVALALFWAAPRGRMLQDRRWASWRTPVVAAGLAGLLALMLLLGESEVVTFRGGLLAAGLLTAVLIAALLAGPSLARTILTWSTLEWIGERSYGIYLWHWPIILVVDAALPATVPDSGLDWFGRALAVLLTLAISAASYRWVELPVRRLGFRQAVAEFIADLRRSWPTAPATKVAAASGVLLLSACSVAVVGAPDKSAVQRQVEANEHIVAESSDHVTATPTPTRLPDTTTASGPTTPSETPSAAKEPAQTKKPTKPDHGPFEMPTGEDITAFGDSLIVTSATGLADRFPGIMMDAKSNRRWSDGIAAVHRRLAEGTVRRAVVIDFGTNGGIPHWQTVRDALDALGPDRMIVLVNLYGVSDWIPDANQALARIAGDYPNVTVADWHSTISAHPDMLQADGVHPNIPGANLYADMVKSAFRRLAEQSTD
ncbi:acyltransferase family protein [Leekyejoonella antrihumi]|nr:acyltransferase family protein [Leekyejoonella antrihumi]